MRVAVLLALLATAVTLVVHPSAGVTGTPVSCQGLRGVDLAPADAVKLVKHRNDVGGTDLAGCVLPRGRVVRIASSAKLRTAVRGYRIRQVVGAIVLLERSSRSPTKTTKTVSVTSLRSGDSYGVAYTCSRPGGFDCASGSRGSTAPAAFVNARGQAAAALFFSGSRTVRVAGYAASGTREDLAIGTITAIPPSSLRLDGSTARWTNAGRHFSAKLPS